MTPLAPRVGAFLNVTAHDPADWTRQATLLRGLDGLSHVEVWLEAVPDEPGACAPLNDLLAGTRTIMHGPFIGLSLVSPWDALRAISIDRLARAAEIGAGFGAEVMTVHPGVASSVEDDDVVRDRLLVSLADLRARIGGALTVSIENMPCRRGASVDGLITLDQCRALVGRDPDTRVTLDVGHAVQNDDKYQPFLAECTSSVADIHLHDGFAGGSAHLGLGAGDLDVAGFAATVVDSGYAGFVSLETLTWEDTESSYGAAVRALGEASRS